MKGALVLKVDISDEEIDKLHELHLHPHPVVRRRALILLLKSQNVAHHKIALIANVCENTVRQCLQTFQCAGITQLETLNFRRPQGRLHAFEAVVRSYFDKTPPATITQACADLERITGVCLKNTQMRAYIKSLGVSHRKVSSIPSKANPQAQEQFHDTQLQPLLALAKEGKRSVYFVDAAHFVWGAFLGYL